MPAAAAGTSTRLIGIENVDVEFAPVIAKPEFHFVELIAEPFLKMDKFTVPVTKIEFTDPKMFPKISMLELLTVVVRILVTNILVKLDEDPAVLGMS